MSLLSITYFRRTQKKESITKKQSTNVESSPKVTLAFRIFEYRQELNRSAPNPARLSKAKFQLTESLVSSNAPNISRFAKEFMSNLSRIVFYKYKLKRHVEDSAMSLKKRLNEKVKRRKAQLKQRIEKGIGRAVDIRMD